MDSFSPSVPISSIRLVLIVSAWLFQFQMSHGMIMSRKGKASIHVLCPFLRMRPAFPDTPHPWRLLLIVSLARIVYHAHFQSNHSPETQGQWQAKQETHFPLKQKTTLSLMKTGKKFCWNENRGGKEHQWYLSVTSTEIINHRYFYKILQVKPSMKTWAPWSRVFFFVLLAGAAQY